MTSSHRRKQITYAAFAAGIELVWEDSLPRRILTKNNVRYAVSWNPLECQSDTFELMLLTGANFRIPEANVVSDSDRKKHLIAMQEEVVDWAAQRAKLRYNLPYMHGKYPEIFPE